MSIGSEVIKARQRLLNAFTAKHLKGVGPIKVDGHDGPATKKRIGQCKFWLGWKSHGAAWTHQLARALRHPYDRRNTSKGTVARGIIRRRRHDAHHIGSYLHPGVTSFDGVRVARWLVPYLQYARAHGWHGRLVSGYRSPAYSDSLCRSMCGAPQCPGRCAGRLSNHSGSARPHGALDVSDYYDFGHIVARAPYAPRIFNALGSRDPVHYSSSGN